MYFVVSTVSLNVINHKFCESEALALWKHNECRAGGKVFILVFVFTFIRAEKLASHKYVVTKGNNIFRASLKTIDFS